MEGAVKASETLGQTDMAKSRSLSLSYPCFSLSFPSLSVISSFCFKIVWIDLCCLNHQDLCFIKRRKVKALRKLLIMKTNEDLLSLHFPNVIEVLDLESPRSKSDSVLSGHHLKSRQHQRLVFSWTRELASIWLFGNTQRLAALSHRRHHPHVSVTATFFWGGGLDKPGLCSVGHE